MQTWVALLRAINVGGRTVKMEVLRACFEDLGHSNVWTFIASGNVIFETKAKASPTLEQKLRTAIEKKLQDELGFEVATILRSREEVLAVAKYEPFKKTEPAHPIHALYVSFYAAPPERGALPRLQALATEDDEFHLHGRELYWLRRAKISDSRITGPAFEKAVGLSGTQRNITTVRKLAAKLLV